MWKQCYSQCSWLHAFCRFSGEERNCKDIQNRNERYSQGGGGRIFQTLYTSSVSRGRSECAEGRYPRRPADQLHSSSSVWCRNPWPSSSSSGSQTNIVETVASGNSKEKKRINQNLVISSNCTSLLTWLDCTDNKFIDRPRSLSLYEWNWIDTRVPLGVSNINRQKRVVVRPTAIQKRSM